MSRVRAVSSSVLPYVFIDTIRLTLPLGPSLIGAGLPKFYFFFSNEKVFLNRFPSDAFFEVTLCYLTNLSLWVFTWILKMELRS